jgi:hypothetical protein
MRQSMLKALNPQFLALSLSTISALLVMGCKRKGEAIQYQPNESQMVGKWVLENSPKMPLAKPPVPVRASSSIELRSNHVARLLNVWVDEPLATMSSGGPSLRSNILMTNDVTWEIKHHMGEWTVQVLLPKQFLTFRIRELSDNDLRLNYEPDPDEEAFIYVRNDRR